MARNYIIKICGNVFREDSLRVASLEPDFMGWIFSPLSPRRIRPQTSGSIISQIRRLHPGIRHVGVFAHNSVGDIIEAARIADLDCLQIVDGAGMIDSVRDFMRLRLHNSISIIPALRLSEPMSDIQLARYGPAEFYIFDSYVEGKPGGTGRLLDTALVRGVTKPFLLAGGLNPQNVREAVETARAAGADVSSGIEDSPGKKNQTRLEAFFAALQQEK